MLVLHDISLTGESIAEMSRVVPDLKLVKTTSKPSREVLADADVYYTERADFDPADAPRLRWVQTDSASTASVWGRPVMQSPVPVCNAGGAYSVAVAECAFSMLLALTRRIPRGIAAQQEHRWPPPEEYAPWCGVDLFGSTIGIVGYGSIGRHIARIAQGFGMNILACKRRPEQHHDDKYLIPGTGDPEGRIPSAWYGIDRLREMLAKSDVVAVTLPGIPTTNALIGAAELAALPEHAWVVNVGRGAVFDEPALVRALREGKLAGAGLDVFVEEPLPADSPFWDLPNVVVMPHIASYTSKQAQRAADALIENLRRHQAGEALCNVIDKQLLY